MLKSLKPELIEVWPGLAPGETTTAVGYDIDDGDGDIVRRTGVTSPELFVYRNGSENSGPFVLVCPGGGYEILASGHEGADIAVWLNSLGYTAAVLHYRVPFKRDGALQDVQRAVSILRSRASEFGIDPDRLGVMGFSAGGHLCARLSVEGDNRAYEPVDAADEFSCRPSFTMLIYPAYLADGSERAQEVVPHAGMPPIFLAQSEDDSYFCTTAYSELLEKAGVSYKNAVYSTGGHRYGLRAPSDVPASKWPEDAAAWLAKLSFK